MSWFGESWGRRGHEQAKRSSASTHHPRSSSDFGDFHSASGSNYQTPTHDQSPSHTPSNGSAAALNDNDLLISFDDVAVPPDRQPTPVAQPLDRTVDLLTEDPQELPARPTLNTQESTPGIRNIFDSSPSRQRHFSTPFPGPSSPPKLSPAGGDIIFQAQSPSRAQRGDATTEFRRIRRLSDQYAMSGKGGSHRSRSEESPTRSITGALAVQKLAKKWKRSVLQNDNNSAEAEGPTKTAQLIDVNHSSPFAQREQIAGAYVAPDGAPGFQPANNANRWNEEDEWANTKLKGRRETTAPVMSQAQAQSLRPHLPARQRLSDNWTLLFSLDQHGASLSTLYRQVETYTKGNRNIGNVLVVRDGQGHTFGIYMSEPIVKREGTYYGSGESFMFKWVQGESSPHVFPWTGRNQYIALCETNLISFGGGGTSYGLLLDSTFSHNSSATSPAFQNEVLCGGPYMSETGVRFDCVGLEVWATS